MAKMTDVKAFLSEGQEKPVEMSEFREFWQACTEAEKEQFKAEVDKQMEPAA